MLFKCALFVRVHFVHFPVSFPVPYCVSRSRSLLSLSLSRVRLIVSPAFPFLLLLVSAIWRRSASLSHDFPRKTFTTPKFSSLPSVFPSRPFVFQFYTTCSGKSGGISPTFRFSFPCPVNELSRSEWEPFPACFSNF